MQKIAISTRYVALLSRGATFQCRTALLSYNTFTLGYILKIKWLVTDVTAVGSPDKAEHAILEVILVGRCFDQ